MSDLAQRKCVPCRGDVEPLKGDALEPLASQLDGWRVVAEHHLEKSYNLPDFAAALDLVNRFGAIAEEENHHPEMVLGWGRVDVRIWTHKIDGLSESDFILAAKLDAGRPGR